MTRLAVVLAGVVLSAATVFAAGEIDYIEDFALARDRAQALQQLIPGSEDYYYYHCLHLQNNEQFDQVDQLLEAWIQRYNYTPRVIEIQNRQALLTYARNPQQSLEYLRQRLGIEFNHQRERIGEKPDLPTQLDPSLISRPRLTRIALEQHQDLSGFEDAALDWLVDSELDPDRRRHLLQRLSRPDHANLASLVVADLDHRYSKPFGALPVHRQLFLEQLEECLRLQPDLLDQTDLVNIYISKLQPSDDVDLRNDPDQQQAFLERLWSFVERLAPAHNSLKAHVLYHRLVLDRSQGVYDKQRFMTYIQLPRQVSYIEPSYMELAENRRHVADLNADYRGVTRLPAIGDDEPLVRSYLQHFFLKETTTEPYEPFINDVYLRHQLAETKIVNGLGEPEQWYSWLPPEQYQALKDRTDIDFAFTNQQRFADDESVALDLYIKNVQNLIVKVFEINTENYYRERGAEVSTDINLDGLTANAEYTYEYSEPPLRRVRRHFDFPALDRPGVYVIDFIGSGMSSRAVLRKGTLRHLVRTSTAGQVFTILDEGNRQVADASIWLAGHRYHADQEGRIVVPFTTNAQRQAIVISRGDFSTLAHFQHEAENYRLAAGIYVDRESLLAASRAQLVIRPALLLSGTPVTLSVLEDVRLQIVSVDHDGVPSTKEVQDFELHEDRESVYEFQVPPRLARISFTLSAKVQNLSRNEKVSLSASDEFLLNQIDTTDTIEDLHLAKIDGQYVVQLLGKTGEAKPDRPVQFSLKHRDFTQAVPVTLQTDLQGRVHLGPLDEIHSITATSPQGNSHTWTLGADEHSYYRTLHGVAGTTIQVPYSGSLDEPRRSELSLLELRGNTFLADRFDALSISDGMLQIQGLDPGDYDLLLKRSGQHIRLRVVDGPRQGGYALGANRLLELRAQQPLQIAAVDADADGLRIRLANANRFARVHVFATRYEPAFSVFDKLGSIVDAEPFVVTPRKAVSQYVAGRNIGDEYQYIIDRQYARKYPGNMLERPSVLLNPFALRSTETGQQEAQAGSDFAPAAAEPQSAAARGAAKKSLPAETGSFANLDFLSGPAAVVLNLVPDEDGVVTIPQDQLRDRQHLHVVAIDPLSTAYRSVSLPEKETPFADLRLAQGLDPQRHFTQQKRISVVRGGERFVLDDAATSRLEIYDSLARVYALYATLSGDAKLAEFGFLLVWPELEPAAKREKYSKYACHELNFFLYKKDPQFFDEVVRPYLENKKDKTFLDRWLVGQDLELFLEPWNYAQLNVVERILLSQRISEDRAFTTRDVRDRFQLLPPNVDRYNQLFLTAIKGTALEADKATMLGTIVADADALVELMTEEAPANLSAILPKDAAASRRRHSLARENRAAGGEALRLAEKEELGDEMDWGFQSPAAGRADLFFGQDRFLRERARRFYQKLEKTQEWAENNYYQLPIQEQNAELITVSAFWRDYAEHDPQQPFYSVNLAEASTSFSEMMFALALLDVPFTAGEHKTEFEEGRLTLEAAAPLVAFHEEIREATSVAEGTPILVSQNFFRHGDRYRYVDNQQVDKFVTDEFLVHTVYGAQVVVTNPTSAPQKLDVLVQIPVGALPVSGGQQTRSVNIDLQPYHTQTIEYYFYFPEAGEYPHYPVHVARNELLLAHAEPFDCTVVEQLSRIDRESWDYISQNGSSEDVLNYLREHNLHRTDLDKIAFRMADKPFFLKVVELLEQRHAYNHILWSYGIRHDHPPAVRQYLQHADEFVVQCGAWIDSPLLTSDPVVRRAYQHLDYRPLVNARTHQLGRRRQIVNDRLWAQYHGLLRIISYRRELAPDDLLAVTYYLLLQDRVEEAIGFFEQINASQLETKMQYDYFATYLDLYREDIAAARQTAQRYTDHPVDAWRNAFVAVDKQLDEIQGADVEVLDPESRDQTQTQLAASEASFDFQVEARRLAVTYQNLDRVQVNYYLMDLELLFSRNPFVQQFTGEFSHIRPNLTQSVALPADRSSLEFALPDELHNSNVLVESVGAGQTKSQAYYSNSLALQTIENYGQLRVATDNPGKPLAKVYVKVYARMQNGQVRFYKDGYTDLRGRFDYASLNTNELDHVERFSLLVMSEEHGAVVREVAPPKR